MLPAIQVARQGGMHLLQCEKQVMRRTTFDLYEYAFVGISM
jgi:hypothetical protein